MGAPLSDAPCIKRFLIRAGWGDARRQPLASDASSRRYERLTNAQDARAMLMIAPFEPTEQPLEPPYITAAPFPFIQITRHLRGLGLSAPEVLCADTDQGLLLLEDLGDDLFAQVLALRSDEEWCLYEAAVDLLADLARSAPPQSPRPPDYDSATLLFEAGLVLDWYAPQMSGQRRLSWHFAMEAAFDPVASPENAVLCLRDVHAENLLWLPDRSGIKRVGLLDYQDGLMGHPAYDLVSLLEDARRDVAPLLRTKLIARYLAATGFEPDAFQRAYATLGAQRNLKVLGIFARLCVRDGKPGYLQHMPRVWAHLMRNLEHPALSDLRDLVLADLRPPDDAVIAMFETQQGQRAGNG